jgi:glycosyltransferase involved in cell wall biosynthesis
MPHVSVVVPVFNSALHIAGALRSVFAQTFADREVIVVDDGSEDRDPLMEALAEFCGRIVYVRQENGGPAKARNIGVAHATGELVAFLDADDEWLPEKLARQVQYFREYPKTGLLHSAVVGGTGDGAISGPPRYAFCELFHTDFFIRTVTVMLPRRIFHEAGGFDERREIHVEDWDLWLRIAVHHPIGYLGEPLACHRRGGLMSSQIDRTYAAQILVMEKNRALCREACALHRSGPESCDRRRRQLLHRSWGDDLLERGDRVGARRQLARALKFEPFDRWALRLYVSTFANERWRARARTLLRARRESTPKSTAPSSSTRQSTSISLVHDTTYRRLRRGLIGTVHDLDDSVCRRERKRVLFEAASPMSFIIFRPIYERLKNDPRIEIWFTAYGGVWEPEQIFGRFGISERVVSRGSAEWLKVDAYVNADFWDMTWLRRRTRRIHLFHGVAGKYGLDAPVDLAPTITAFDCLMFINDDRRQRYVDAGLVPDNALGAPLVGYPKLDSLVDGSLNRADLRRALSLDSSTPTVLYAPTWSPHSSLNAMGGDIIERLASEGFQVIVKLHDRSYDQRARGSGGIDWAARLKKYDGHPLVRVAQQPDGSPFMVASDAMVSDHSSIAFEYTLLDRPIVVIDRPGLIEHARINPEKVHQLRRAAAVVRDPEEVVRSLRHALHHPQDLSSERTQIAGDLFYQPGTATERALAHLYRILDLSIASRQATDAAANRTRVAAG